MCYLEDRRPHVVSEQSEGSTECLRSSKYKLDAESKGSTRFRDPKARGCGVPSAARALLRA